MENFIKILAMEVKKSKTAFKFTAKEKVDILPAQGSFTLRKDCIKFPHFVAPSMQFRYFLYKTE